MKTDYGAWTLDALQKQFVDTGAELTKLENERQALLAEMDRRKIQVAAVARVSVMTEAEKDALREVLGKKEVLEVRV